MTILSTIREGDLKLVLFRDGKWFGWMVMPSTADPRRRDLALYSDYENSKASANSTGRRWLEYHQSMLTNINGENHEHIK